MVRTFEASVLERGLYAAIAARIGELEGRGVDIVGVCRALVNDLVEIVASHESSVNLRADDSPALSIDLSKGFALISVRPQEGDEGRWRELRAECLQRLAAGGIPVEMLQFMPLRMRFVVVNSLAQTARDKVRDCGLAWRMVRNCSKVCIVGAGIRTTAGVFDRALTGLAERTIPVLHFSDSSVTMSVIVPDTNGAEAERILRDVLSGAGTPSLNSPISFDPVLGRVRVNGEVRRLGSRQAKLLEFLVSNMGRVIEVEEAARQLFGADGEDEVAAVRVHIHNLRKKIEIDPDNPRYLVTVPSQGYVLVR